MIGKVRIRREPKVINITDGKAVYIPEGARFKAFEGDHSVATLETLSAVIIEDDKLEAVVAARMVQNDASILVGTTNHSFRPSYAGNATLPDRPDDVCDWREAVLLAEPVGPFRD